MCALILTDITFVNKTSHGIFSDLIILYVFAESTNTVRSYFTGAGVSLTVWIIL